MTGGNRNDVTQLMPLIQDIPPVSGHRRRPRRRPDTVSADRAYDHDKYRKQVRAVGVALVIARRGNEHGSGLGQYRWVVEQTFALLHWFRRLRIRWEIRNDIHEAFLRLACAIICLRRLTSLSPCKEFIFRASAVGSTGCSAARPASAAKSSTLQLGARRPTISSPRTPTCQPTRNTRRSSRSPCVLRVLSRRVRRMTPKRRKRRGESVPSPEQDKAEVVRAVLTRRAIGVVTSAAAETARDHRHATSSCGRAAAIPPPLTSTRPVDPDVVPTHGDVIVSDGSGDEVLRGEDVVAHNRCQPL